MQKNALVVMFLSFFAVCGQAKAVENIHFGKLVIDPYVSLSEMWSDNIYFTPTDVVKDRITELRPGVKLQFPFGMHRAEAEYYATLDRYNTYRGEDTTDHTGRGLVELKFGSFFGLTLTDDYTKNHEGRGQSATGFIEVYRKNTPMVSAFYQLAGRSKIQFDYSQTSYNFMTSNFRDRDEHLVAGYLYYRFFPKTSLFIEYDHKAVDYTLPQNGAGGVSLDNTQNSALLGVTWEATAVSKGTIKGGRTKKDFDVLSVNDLTMWSWYLNIDHRFSDLTSLSLVGKREPNETNYLGTTFYITTGASADFSHRMFSKTDLLLRASYGKDDFSDARKDKTTLLGGGLKYWIKEWFDVGVNYQQQKRDSNLEAADYLEHRTSVVANMVF